MTAALLWSGGKDSMLALDRSVAAGADVRVLFNLFDAASERVRFHGVRRELLEQQAQALGMELLQLPTTPADFEAVFLEGLRQLRDRGLGDVIFGNIHLADVRAWYEERTTAAGFVQHEPLWGADPADVVREVIGRGYRAVLTGIDTTRLPSAFLGRELDLALLHELQELHGVDAAGEQGEYHTFVFAGPLFSAPVAVTAGDVFDAGTHALLDLVPRSFSPPAD